MEFKSPFKLSLIFLLVTAPTSVVLAQPYSLCSPCTCSFNGFSIGVGLGATTFMTKENINAALSSEGPSFGGGVATLAETDPVFGNNVALSASSNNYRYSGMGALFVGYGNVFNNNLYLGAELGINIFGANETSHKGSFISNSDVISTSTDFGFPVIGELLTNNGLNSKTKVTRDAIEPFFDVKFGYLVTPTMLAYLRGGINFNNIVIKPILYQINVIDNRSDDTTSIRFLPPHLQVQSPSGIGWRVAEVKSRSHRNLGVGATRFIISIK